MQAPPPPGAHAWISGAWGFVKPDLYYILHTCIMGIAFLANPLATIPQPMHHSGDVQVNIKPGA